MKYFLSIIALFLLTACFSEKVPLEVSVKEPQKEPKKEPKKEIKVLSEEEKFLLTLDKEQKDVYQNLKLYLSYIERLDIDRIIDMTYPKLFLAFSKNIFRAQIFTMANSSQVEIQSLNTNILNIEDVQSFSNGNFTQISYNSVVTVYFKNPELYNTERSLNTLYSILVRKYGRESIYVDVKKRLITITKNVKMLAIKESPNHWKFVGDNPKYREFYPSFIPYEVLNRI
jgi:hypothetical protein